MRLSTLTTTGASILRCHHPYRSEEKTGYFFFDLETSGSEMAPRGQASTQVPQPSQRSASTRITMGTHGTSMLAQYRTHFPHPVLSAATSAWFGHVSTHRRQPSHRSVSTTICPVRAFRDEPHDGALFFPRAIFMEPPSAGSAPNFRCRGNVCIVSPSS
jgi:hypothetical protein